VLLERLVRLGLIPKAGEDISRLPGFGNLLIDGREVFLSNFDEESVFRCERRL